MKVNPTSAKPRLATSFECAASRRSFFVTRGIGWHGRRRIWRAPVLTLAVMLGLAGCRRPVAVAKCEAGSPRSAALSATGLGPVGLSIGPHPLMGDKLVRYEKNPVISGSNISPSYSLTADPYLLVVNGRLYVFFEALRERQSPPTGCCGEIWMAESQDGFNWSGFRQVSSRPVHMSHPHAFIHQGIVHLLYNQNADGRIFHRASALASFPSWSEETEVFKGSRHGWHHLVEFFILEHADLWYLIGITGDGSKEDQWLRGRWAKGLPADWNTESEEITPCPLLDINQHQWVKQIVEITPLRMENELYLLMGATRRKDSKRAIGTFAVTHLTPARLEGRWLSEDHTFPLSSTGWDDTDIHRASAVVFKDRWFYVYDARKKGEGWKIGIATAPLR